MFANKDDQYHHIIKVKNSFTLLYFKDCWFSSGLVGTGAGGTTSGLDGGTTSGLDGGTATPGATFGGLVVVVVVVVVGGNKNEPRMVPKPNPMGNPKMSNCFSCLVSST